MKDQTWVVVLLKPDGGLAGVFGAYRDEATARAAVDADEAPWPDGLDACAVPLTDPS